ncbi:hypothetical protein [Mesorhizobium sp. M2C.T.Ca.TU.002.02.1.1]|jgi:hypothetical protein|uniref:hypothetical protein n=1 Tax=Mesorhizobium sp. M2C.T.Ca.TU.002.02.1.1 TaxID=2496788 RepID=UPI000FCAAA7E|nr:hypothetical protein [Mesorhizobium sp. M2C.T.Ca.TU.002.02.1.1]RUU58498.1 hypothetical protein EOD07_09830 [Mesorhizobium sp. M2C.T.Ca.TU.002.02.1.1]
MTITTDIGGTLMLDRTSGFSTDDAAASGVLVASGLRAPRITAATRIRCVEPVNHPRKDEHYGYH